MSQSIQSQGKVWFVTGASRGFGALIVRDALQRGDRVIATARNPQQVIDAFGEQPNLLAVKVDVTKEEDAVEAVRQGVARFGGSTCWSTTPATASSVPSRKRAWPKRRPTLIRTSSACWR